MTKYEQSYPKIVGYMQEKEFFYDSFDETTNSTSRFNYYIGDYMINVAFSSQPVFSVYQKYPSKAFQREILRFELQNDDEDFEFVKNAINYYIAKE